MTILCFTCYYFHSQKEGNAMSQESYKKITLKTRGPTPKCPSPISNNTALPVNMYQTKNDLVLNVFVPGVKRGQVNTLVTDKAINIEAKYYEGQDISESDFLYRDRKPSSLKRTIPIPFPVQVDKSEATLNKGIYTLRLPKVKPEK